MSLISSMESELRNPTVPFFFLGENSLHKNNAQNRVKIMLTHVKYDCANCQLLVVAVTIFEPEPFMLHKPFKGKIKSNMHQSVHLSIYTLQNNIYKLQPVTTA